MALEGGGAPALKVEGGETPQVVLGEDGEPLSKNALKKLLKAEHAAKMKAEKAAAKAANAVANPQKKKEEKGEGNKE